MKHREFVAAPALMTCLFLGPAASALEREEHGEWHIASAVAERLPSPRADLKTAKTIYISQLPQDLHYHIAALLSLEGPLEVVKDKELADLWMKGRETKKTRRIRPLVIVGGGKPGRTAVLDVRGLVRTLQPARPYRQTVTLRASVYIVPRGSEEILWAAKAKDRSAVQSSSRGQQQMAFVIVSRLQKAIEKTQRSK